ncbi:MAG: hypothetical protein QXD92_00945 [Candidatus Korarchaeum sp.]
MRVVKGALITLGTARSGMDSRTERLSELRTPEGKGDVAPNFSGYRDPSMAC